MEELQLPVWRKGPVSLSWLLEVVLLWNDALHYPIVFV